jgi:hypothetical protein
MERKPLTSRSVIGMAQAMIQIGAKIISTLGGLEYNEETGCYTVEDVDYCIDMAQDRETEEGACYGDPDMEVLVDEI